LQLIGDADPAYKATYLQGQGANFHELGVACRTRAQRAGSQSAIAVDDLLEDIRLQGEAYRDFSESLDLCRTFGLRMQKPDGLRRIASVFKELAELAERLERVTNIDRAEPTLRALRAELFGFDLSEERYWRGINRLPVGLTFSELNAPLERAQRLLEISFLEADAVDLYHECLDGLSEAARVAVRLGRGADVKRYVRFAWTLRGYTHQEKLFDAQLGITVAHLDYDQGRLEPAIAKYGRHFPALAAIGGYAAKRLDAQFSELESRFERTAPYTLSQRTRALVAIRDAWSRSELKRSHPQLLFKIQALLSKLANSVVTP
jgi:hypothetical protein